MAQGSAGTAQESRNDDSSVYLAGLGAKADWMALPSSLWQSLNGAAGFRHEGVNIFADCGIIADDT